MPRASWRGFLRLSLVSCPVYLSPATTRTKSIRLHQVWRPPQPEEPEEELRDKGQNAEIAGVPRRAATHNDAGLGKDQSGAATRVALRPHDPGTGKELEKGEVVKGYEYERGQFVSVTREELKALGVENSKVIDLEKFSPRGEIDPVYLDTPYYLYPDGPLAIEALRVIDAAMVETGVVGIGRLTLGRRERIVTVEPRGSGMALFTLRAAEEVRVPQFPEAEAELDHETVGIAKAIIAQRICTFDPTNYRDRYQEALRQLIEAKMKGRSVKPREVLAPRPVIDLMAALKRSLARERPADRRAPSTAKKANKPIPDRNQLGLLLPVSGGRRPNEEASPQSASPGAKRRKRA
jgi:DNA end-binding protein Ku